MARQLSRRRTEPVNPEPEDGDSDEYYDDDNENDDREETSRRRPQRNAATTRRRSSREDSGDDDDRGSARRRASGPTTPRDTATRDSGSRRRSASEDDDDDDSARGRGSSARSGRKRPSEAAPAREPSRGWDKYKKAKSRANRWNDADKFAVEEGAEELIVFLEPEPFATWNEHFIRELDGKKSWVCLDEDCPLCQRGDSPSYRAAFNIAAFDDKGNPEVKYWLATPGPLDEIEAHANNERYGPLDRDGNYFVVSKKKGSNKFFKYSVTRVTEDQVQDEFDYEPLLDSDIADLIDQGLFEEKDVYQASSRKELRDIARGLDD